MFLVGWFPPAECWLVMPTWISTLRVQRNIAHQLVKETSSFFVVEPMFCWLPCSIFQQEIDLICSDLRISFISVYDGFSGFPARNILDYGMVYRYTFSIISYRFRKNETKWDSATSLHPFDVFLVAGGISCGHRSTNEAWCDRNLHLTWKTEQHGSSGELRGCKMLKLEAFLRWPVFKSCLIDSMLLRYCCRRCCFLHFFSFLQQ